MFVINGFNENDEPRYYWAVAAFERAADAATACEVLQQAADRALEHISIDVEGLLTVEFFEKFSFVDYVGVEFMKNGNPVDYEIIEVPVFQRIETGFQKVGE